MKLLSLLALSASLTLSACSRGSYDGEEEGVGGTSPRGGSSGVGGMAPMGPLPQDTDFVLREEWSGPCEKANAVDVNLGNAPEVFVRAAACQIDGAEPDQATIDELSMQLRSSSYVRRVDIARTLCKRASKNCVLNYTDPWQQQVDLTAACVRKGTRELGAVLMYWSECPRGVNCGLDWANTHAPGMNVASQLLGFGTTSTGYYNPTNAGFWRRELLDARWSGLQYLALNTFGPDLPQLSHLVEALDDIQGGIGIVLFDDTWGWGRGSAPWSQLPSFNDSEAAAQLIFQKWQLFYEAVPSKYWYRYQNKPVVAFYNAGTLRPLDKSAATLARLKTLFQEKFGEEPFLVVDTAFFADGGMGQVAGARFKWNTFDGNALSHFDIAGVTFDSFMAKWDSVGRDRVGELATAADRLIKGPELLDKYLSESAAASLGMIATWNDLGEGTGVTRNYDYYYQGQWLPPHTFMSRIRASQCQ